MVVITAARAIAQCTCVRDDHVALASKKQATEFFVSRGARYTHARRAQRWSRLNVKWEMSA